MCADFVRLEEQVRAIERAGVGYIHVDIMDGRFVPNFTLGPDFVAALRRLTNLPMDYHLMVQEPERHLALFDIRPGDIVSVHQEATVHLQRTLHDIRSTGASSGVALNPGTPIYTLEDVLDDLDVVLLMTVNPGFAGQRLIPGIIPKITRLKAWLRQNNRLRIQIEVDGNVSFENAALMRAAGADIFVGGTSSIFRKDLDLTVAAEHLRASIARDPVGSRE